LFQLLSDFVLQRHSTKWIKFGSPGAAPHIPWGFALDHYILSTVEVSLNMTVDGKKT